MKLKYIVGIAIIVGFLIFAAFSFQKSLTPYVSIEEARRTDAIVQVKGKRIPGSERYDSQQHTFNFKMTDGNGTKIQVVYEGVKPSNFEHAKEIVIIGRFHNGIFEANELLVKCPSKYESEQAKGV